MPHNTSPAEKQMRGSIQKWIDDTLWSRWGWHRWSEDNFDLPYRDAKEKARIQSAVEFVLRALGNNPSSETQSVADSIVERRNAERLVSTGGAK